MSLLEYAKTARQREAIKAWQDCGEVVAKAAAYSKAFGEALGKKQKAITEVGRRWKTD